MKSDKSQTMALIGIALLIVASIIIYISLSQPKVYENQSPTVSVQVATTTQKSGKDSQTTTSSQNNNNVNNNQSANTVATNVNYPINLNTATAEQLMTISGVGETKANAIIAYRNHIGKYTNVQQIMDIEGIGQSTYDAIAPYLTV